jgi:biotin carboxyl carrier protein
MDERDLEVDIQRLDEGGVLVVRVGDQSFTITTQAPGEDGKWTVNESDSNHEVRLLKRSGHNFQLEFDGRKRDVEFTRVRKASTSTAQTPATNANGTERVAGGIYPPMPGKITEVHVSVGDEVTTGDTLCILEAMKMFNELKSTKDGVVKNVNVEEGSSVTPTDLIILIE